MHMYVSKLTIIGWDNGLSPDGAKPLSEPMLVYHIVNWSLRNKLQWNFNQNSYVFIQENAFEIVVWNGGHFVSTLMC